MRCILSIVTLSLLVLLVSTTRQGLSDAVTESVQDNTFTLQQAIWRASPAPSSESNRTDEADAETAVSDPAPNNTAEIESDQWQHHASSNPSLLPTLLPGLITHGSRLRPEVSLTFDACEINTAGYDVGVINDLLARQTPATLFLGGKWMLDHASATRALAQVPYFELANHSYNHPHFSGLSPAQIRAQVLLTQNIMYAMTGKRGHLFRFPYGAATPTAVAEVNALGLETIQWDDVSGDPSPLQTTASEINTVLRYAQNGSIIIMHMNGRGWHTAAALPLIITALRARGFNLVTVSQLLSDSQSTADYLNRRSGVVGP